ncbi:MAG: hypothetical protein JO126_03780 [Alphaproteobacteria bacterium]|nr:hypothetical protein [Alphaproteobacteria bacterium]
MPSALAQDAVVRTLPQIQAQAVSPQTQRAIDPSSKAYGGNKARGNGDRAKGGDRSGGDRGGRGSNLNIRI